MRACHRDPRPSAQPKEAQPLPKLSDTWTARVWAEFRAGNLTRAARDVLLTLHTYRAAGGCAWPSHQTIADRAKCCVRTVQDALRAARGLGLIVWTERRARSGWRWLRTSNLYRFLAPAGPVSPSRSTTGKRCRGPGKKDSPACSVAAREASGPSSGSDD